MILKFDMFKKEKSWKNEPTNGAFNGGWKEEEEWMEMKYEVTVSDQLPSIDKKKILNSVVQLL